MSISSDFLFIYFYKISCTCHKPDMPYKLIHYTRRMTRLVIKPCSTRVAIDGAASGDKMR